MDFLNINHCAWVCFLHQNLFFLSNCNVHISEDFNIFLFLCFTERQTPVKPWPKTDKICSIDTLNSFTMVPDLEPAAAAVVAAAVVATAQVKLYLILPLELIFLKSIPNIRVPICGKNFYLGRSKYTILNCDFCSWHVIRKAIWYVTNLRIFEVLRNIYFILFSTCKTETANRAETAAWK